MSLYIKLCGLALMMIAALAISKGYREYVNRRISEQESFVSLLRHLEGRIRRYLMPIGEALGDFSDENLSRLGFFDGLANGEGLSQIFERLSPRFSLGEETRAALSEIFSRISLGYKDEVISEICDGAIRLEKILEKERVELRKNERVASVVLVASVFGAFILLV